MLYQLYIIFTFTILYAHVQAQSPKLINDGSIQKSEQKSNNELVDNVAAADEHHKIVILVPQIIRQEKKKPKSHHHHGKVVPVVHSGKVIHAHHHHGTVDHKHGHEGNAKHDHKHTGTAGHKHSHFGVGTLKHKHSGKASHDHKHAGKGEHKHSHSGKGSIHHLHGKHHIHPKPPTKKFTNPFYLWGGASENYAIDGPRVKIDSEILRNLNPANAVNGATFADGNLARIIHIRIPDENEENGIRELDESELSALKKNYIAEAESDRYTEGLEYVGNLDDIGEENEETDGESEYQLGDGYKLAASAAARASVSAEDNNMLHFTERDAVDPFLPALTRNNVVAYSDTYHYQY